MKISFLSEEINFKLKSPSKIRAWIKEVIAQENRTPGEITYIFCPDSYLHRINMQYLKHDDLTDIITFDNSEDPATIEGDIFISTERVADNAHSFGSSFDSELHRVMIHGILHLCGFHDKKPGEQELMRKKEDACLSLLRV